MSSILDSLKKLEKETSQQDHLLPRAKVDRKGFIPKHAIGVILVVCVCIGAIGFAIYYRGIPEKKTEPIAGDVTPAPQPSATLDDRKNPLASSYKPPAPLPAASINRTSTVSAGVPETRTPGSESSAKPISAEGNITKREVKSEAKPIAEVKKPAKEIQVKDTAVQESEPDTLPVEEDLPGSLDDVSKKRVTQIKKPLPIDRLEGVSIKIQAISWSDIPEESLAVINNQVLREGDEIEGYHISHINMDDIVLSRGDKAYRLDFRSKGWP